VLWFTVWFMVILKIPILYLGLVIWYAVKDPPDGETDAAAGEAGQGGGPGRRPDRDRRLRRPGRGPHGSPARRPVPARVPSAAGGRRG